MGSSTSDQEDESANSLDLFQEPKDFYQQEKPATHTIFNLKNGRTLNLRLVGQSPLWGHLLWNAGQVVTDYLQENSERFVKGKNVLELGAGAGLPSLTCAIYGASHVVVTDYPDPDLISNLEFNIGTCLALDEQRRVTAQGFLWGQYPRDLFETLTADQDGFDTLILADILFNHSEHKKLLATVQSTLKKSADSVALVFFTPYRPWLLQNDLAFFDLARADGLIVTKVLEHTMDKVMFENDPGDETLRRTVFGYTLTRDLPAS